MREGPLKRKKRNELQSRITDIDLLTDFYTKTKEQDVRFTSIESMEELDLAEGVTIPDIMVAQRDDGKADIFNRTMVMEIEPTILDEIEVRGLPKDKTLSLIEVGMQPEEILEAVSAAKLSYPTLEGDSMANLIESQVAPEVLQDMEAMGLSCVPMEDGTVQVQALSKVAEVDEEGRTVLSPKIQEQIEVFEQMGMLEMSDELILEVVEVEDKDKAKAKGKNKAKSKSLAKSQTQGDEQEEEQDLAEDMQEAEEEQKQEEQEEEKDEAKTLKLKVVPLKEKAKAKTQDELEKEEIAKKIGCEPEDVICVIRFSSREIASQFLNNDVSLNTSQVLVRLTNNKFWMLEEDGEGKKTKSKGLEVSPASKILAEKMQDTKHKGDTWVLPGDVEMGKTDKGVKRNYDFVRIMNPGESRLDGGSTAVYAGLNAADTQEMRLIASRNNNIYDLDEVSTKSEIPSRVFMTANSGARAKMKLRNVKGNEGVDTSMPEIEEQSSSSLEDLGRQQELLKRLEIVERAIEKIEMENGITQPQDSERADSGNTRQMDPLVLEKDSAQALPDLYSQRAEILSQLGISEADAVKVREDMSIEDIGGPERGQKRPH